MAEFMFQNVVYRATVYRTGGLLALANRDHFFGGDLFLSALSMLPSSFVTNSSGPVKSRNIFQPHQSQNGANIPFEITFDFYALRISQKQDSKELSPRSLDKAQWYISLLGWVH